MKNIYHLKRESADHDEAKEMVVIATDELEARHVASKQAGDEGVEIWQSAFVAFTLIGISFSDEARVVCRDFFSA